MTQIFHKHNQFGFKDVFRGNDSFFSDACFYSNLATRIFLRACLFCLDPDCCKSRFHPGTCVYSNLETKTLLQQSRDPNGIQIAVRAGSHPGTCVYSNLETKTLLQQSRDPKWDPDCCKSRFPPFYLCLQQSRDLLLQQCGSNGSILL